MRSSENGPAFSAGRSSSRRRSTSSTFISTAEAEANFVRPCSFDVDLPFECDDEYWQTGSSATNFVQPADHQPSRLTAFILTLQLQKIFSTILRDLVRADARRQQPTITAADSLLSSLLALQYNTKRARGRSPAEIVESLEQQLQEWLNVLPPHLQWDPNQPEDTWFRQAVDLHLQYNIVLVRAECELRASTPADLDSPTRSSSRRTSTGRSYPRRASRRRRPRDPSRLASAPPTQSLRSCIAIGSGRARSICTSSTRPT